MIVAGMDPPVYMKGIEGRDRCFDRLIFIKCVCDKKLCHKSPDIRNLECQHDFIPSVEYIASFTLALESSCVNGILIDRWKLVGYH